MKNLGIWWVKSQLVFQFFMAWGPKKSLTKHTLCTGRLNDGFLAWGTHLQHRQSYFDFMTCWWPCPGTTHYSFAFPNCRRLVCFWKKNHAQRIRTHIKIDSRMLNRARPRSGFCWSKRHGIDWDCLVIIPVVDHHFHMFSTWAAWHFFG